MFFIVSEAQKNAIHKQLIDKGIYESQKLLNYCHLIIKNSKLHYLVENDLEPEIAQIYPMLKNFEFSPSGILSDEEQFILYNQAILD